MYAIMCNISSLISRHRELNINDKHNKICIASSAILYFVLSELVTVHSGIVDEHVFYHSDEK